MSSPQNNLYSPMSNVYFSEGLIVGMKERTHHSMFLAVSQLDKASLGLADISFPLSPPNFNIPSDCLFFLNL